MCSAAVRGICVSCAEYLGYWVYSWLCWASAGESNRVERIVGVEDVVGRQNRLQAQGDSEEMEPQTQAATAYPVSVSTIVWHT